MKVPPTLWVLLTIYPQLFFSTYYYPKLFKWYTLVPCVSWLVIPYNTCFTCKLRMKMPFWIIFPKYLQLWRYLKVYTPNYFSVHHAILNYLLSIYGKSPPLPPPFLI